MSAPTTPAPAVPMAASRVVAVLGASGGLGSSTLAAGLAAALAHEGGCTVIDLDGAGAGLDVLLGIEAVPGARWSGVRFAGGRLDPETVRSGLPVWSGARVLAVDRFGACPDGDRLAAVVRAAACLDPVVLDVPRGRADLLDRAALVVVLCRPDVPGLTAARACVADLQERGLRVGLVVRGGTRRASEQASALVGAPVLGWLPAIRGEAELDPSAPPRPLRRLAAALAAALGAATEHPEPAEHRSVA